MKKHGDKKLIESFLENEGFENDDCIFVTKREFLKWHKRLAERIRKLSPVFRYIDKK